MGVIANEGVLYIFQSTNTRASLSNAVYSHTKDTTSIWSIHRILTGTTPPNQSGIGSNCNEGVLYIFQSTNTRASLSNAVYSHTKDTTSIWSIHRILTGTTPPDQSGAGSNGNFGVLLILLGSKTRTSLQIVSCHIQDTSWDGGGLTPLQSGRILHNWVVYFLGFT